MTRKNPSYHFRKEGFFLYTNKNRLLRQQEPASTSEDVPCFQQKYCIIFGAAMQAEPSFAPAVFLHPFLHIYKRRDTMAEQNSDDLRMGVLYIRVSPMIRMNFPQMHRGVCSWTMLRITESCCCQISGTSLPCACDTWAVFLSH